MTRAARRARDVRKVRHLRNRRSRGDAGQTVTEYLMILGILTAIIIALTKMIAPAIANGMLQYMERRVVYNSSVAGGVDMAQGVASRRV
jgi:hypothetical protein